MGLTLRILAMMAALMAAAGIVSAARADSRTLPVPAITVYPGDTIRDEALTDKQFPATFPGVAGALDGRSLLIGKVARRTLLPGKPVPPQAVGEADLVVRAVPVRIVVKQGGLTITASASALQDGAAGEVIRVRNVDSGAILTGVVQPDGTVRVGAP